MLLRIFSTRILPTVLEICDPLFGGVQKPGAMPAYSSPPFMSIKLYTLFLGCIRVCTRCILCYLSHCLNVWEAGGFLLCQTARGCKKQQPFLLSALRFAWAQIQKKKRQQIALQQIAAPPSSYQQQRRQLQSAHVGAKFNISHSLIWFTPLIESCMMHTRVENARRRRSLHGYVLAGCCMCCCLRLLVIFQFDPARVLCSGAKGLSVRAVAQFFQFKGLIK